MNETNSDGKLLKKRELAVMLGVSGRTVDNWVANRLIPYLAVSPRLHLFDPVAVRHSLDVRFAVKPNQFDKREICPTP
jgi:hypothetical protein